MQIFLWFGLYFLLALGVIFVTSKASNHIDEIDKKTNLGSAVLGGILFAAVTSLPELVTSIVSTFGIGMDANAGLAFGNILGSNLFNMMILGVVDLIFIKKMWLTNIDKGNKKANFFALGMYSVMIIPVIIFNLLLKDTIVATITNWSFSIISVLIIVLYLINAFTSKNNGEEEQKETKPIKSNLLKFLFWSFFIVVISICITLVTDKLNSSLKLEASFAGAIFLGVATSLPEFTAVISLVKLKNYASAIGNIVGSTLFNLVILSFVDLISPDNVFAALFTNPRVLTNEILLLTLGLFSGLVLFYIFFRKRKLVKSVKGYLLYALPSVLLLLSYITYLILSI